jgi:nicotinamide-nucleotide amidase
MSAIHLILIGDELLSGQRRDLHLQTLAADLTARGARVATCEVIRDEEGAVARAVARFLAPGALIITTGGLGPTLDDLTREGIANATGVRLREDAGLWEDLKVRFQRMGRKISDSNRSQALVPVQGTFFPNAHGTAPGLVFEPPSIEGCCVMALPGPPRELNPMWREQAIPFLAERCNWPPPPFAVHMRFAQMGESSIDEKMRPLLAPYPGIELSSLIRIARVDVTLRLPADYPEGQRILQEIADQTCEEFKAYAYERKDYFDASRPSALDLEEVVSNLLRSRGEKLATAESCTGGMIASWMTDFPGSSDVFLGGVVSYHNSLKENLLGVLPETLDRTGAVSEQTVREMAEGVIQATGADWGVAVSGVAGPSGGTQDKPVGLVWIAVGNGERIDTHRYEFPGGRDAVRERAAVTALRLLWLRLLGR